MDSAKVEIKRTSFYQHEVLSSESSTSSADAREAQIDEKAAASEFPEGGVRAWLTVAGSAVCMFCSFGWLNAVGIFQDYYAHVLLHQYSTSTISWIPSLQIFFLLAGGPFVGKIIDDFGPRVPILVGTLLHVFGLMMLSISRQYYQIMLSQAVCSALGASLIFYPGFSCTATYFNRKRGLAIGLVTVGSSLGGVILPIMVIRLVPRLGFAWTIRVCAFLILALLVFANLTVTSRLKPAKRPFEFMAFVRPLSELKFLALTAAVFLYYWCMFIPINFTVTQARAIGVDATLVQYLVPIFNAASIIGRTVPNVVADKVGPYNMMIVMSAFTAILELALWLPATNTPGLIAFAVLIGIATGAGISLTPVLVAKISNINEIGVRTGTLLAISSVAALTGSPIGASMIETHLRFFQGTILFAGLAGIVATLLFIVARILVGGKTLRV